MGATRSSFRAAVSASLRPQINSMNVIGLVSIPGMMTGNVLAGASPTRAARYQIMIMCMILAANFVSVGLASKFIISASFDERGGLRDDWIITNPAPRISQIISSLSLSPGKVVDVEKAKLMNEKESESLPAIVDVITKVESKKQSDDTSPSFKVALNGSYANGNFIMNANFNVPLKGEIVILEGRSGVGKSTLLRTLADLNSGFVSIQSRSVSLAGVERLSFSPNEWKRRVLYIPQDGATSIQGTAESFI